MFDKVTGTEAMLREAQHKTWQLVPPLDLCHDLYMDKNVYQVLILLRLYYDLKLSAISCTWHCVMTAGDTLQHRLGNVQKHYYY